MLQKTFPVGIIDQQTGTLAITRRNVYLLAESVEQEDASAYLGREMQWTIDYGEFADYSSNYSRIVERYALTAKIIEDLHTLAFQQINRFNFSNTQRSDRHAKKWAWMAQNIAEIWQWIEEKASEKELTNGMGSRRFYAH